MRKFMNVTKTVVSTLALSALIYGGVFAGNGAVDEQTKAPGAENGTAGRSITNVGEGNAPSIVWAPDYEETIEKMRANPEYYEEIINRDREEARRKKAEEELEAVSADRGSPAVVYAPDFEETIERMSANPDNSYEYFEDYIRDKWGDRKSETMIVGE